MNMLSKKAQITVQLNWIFVMIAGGAILLFFLSIVRSQISTQNNKIVVTTLNDLDALFTATFIATESHHLTPVPSSDIIFDEYDYKIDKAKKEIGNRVIFSPRVIHGDLLFSWSKEVTVPYRVSNVLYLTSPEIYYLFVYPDDDYDLRVELESLLASDKLVVDQNIRQGFNYDFVSVKDLPQKILKNNYMTRLIFLNTGAFLNNNYLKKEEDDSVSAIKITTNNLDRGTIDFYEKNDYQLVLEPDGGGHKFISFEFLLAGVFSDDVIIYATNVEKWMQRFSYLGNLYYNRMNLIMEEYERRFDFCAPRYIPIVDFMGPYFENFNIAYDTNMFESIVGYSDRIKEFNNYLVTGSCEPIY